MDQRQRIFNMLSKTSKTQLSRKLELSLSDDASSAATDLKSLFSEVNGVTDKIDEVISRARSVYAEIQQIQNALQVSYDIALRVKGDIEESADSLGIDPEIIGGYNDLSNAIDMAEVNAEDLASYAQDDIFSGL